MSTAAVRFTRSEITDTLVSVDNRFTLYADGRIIATVFVAKTGELMPRFKKNTPKEWELFAQWCSYRPGRFGPVSRTPIHREDAP